MIELLPAVLKALRQYKFNGSPLWKMVNGKDHVKNKVTFHSQLTNATTRREPKVGGSLHPLLASGTDHFKTDVSSTINAASGEGDATTPDADTTTSTGDHHTTTLHDYSDHHRITYYLQTSTSFISRCSTKEENKDHFTDQRLHRTDDQILLQPDQEAIPTS